LVPTELNKVIDINVKKNVVEFNEYFETYYKKVEKRKKKKKYLESFHT
jgi:hypothetical protein